MNTMLKMIIDDGVVTGLRQLFDEDQEGQAFLNALIQVFKDTGAESLAALRAAQARRALAELARHAHKMKGLSRNIGAARLGDVCHELEMGAVTIGQPGVDQLCAAVDREFTDSCEELTRAYLRPA